MKLFNKDIYIQLKQPTGDVKGYFCKGYEYSEDGKLYLISGYANIYHDIDDVYEYYANIVLQEISKIKK